MTDLLERLRKVEPDLPGDRTRWYRNPDGHEAAAEIERLREALQWIAGCEGGDIFDLWKEMRDTARVALRKKD